VICRSFAFGFPRHVCRAADLTCFTLSFRVVQHLAAAERQPPNRHDLFIKCTRPDTIKWDDPLTIQKAIGCVDVPGLPNSRCITNALSRTECEQLLLLSEAAGYLPDEPLVSHVLGRWLRLLPFHSWGFIPSRVGNERKESVLDMHNGLQASPAPRLLFTRDSLALGC
jgi:hypothetical protein